MQLQEHSAPEGNQSFRIHSICVVKNEGDIIETCLRAASQWSDRILVFDNGSTDGTWEKVCAMQSNKIIPWKQEDKVFQESLRAEVFNAFREDADEGDWWCRLDADEFYVVDPREFLADIPRPYHTVWGLAIEYYLTPRDLKVINFDRPLEERLAQLRYYSAVHSEPRFFRHRNRLKWPLECGHPVHIGPTWEKRILYRHYKYRSPEQVRRRLATRQESIRRGFSGWGHARYEDWSLTLGDPDKLHYDAGDGHYMIDESRLPRHVDPPGKLELKLLLHTLGIWP